MLRLFLLVLIAGCGRIGFDGSDAGSGSGDATPRDGVGADVAPPPDPRVVVATGAEGVNDVGFDAAGNLAITGDYIAPLTVGGMSATLVGTRDLFVAVTDPDGAALHLWTGGATQLGSGQNLAWFPDGFLGVGGYFAGTLSRGGGLNAGSRQAALVMRFAADGTLALAQHYPSSSNVQGRGLAVRADRIAIIGVYGGQPMFGGMPLPATSFDNGFLATMDLAGGTVRTRAFNGSGDVFVNDVAFGPTGDVYITGRFNTTTDFGGGPVGVQPGGSSVFVARYDATLSLIWARTFASGAAGTNLTVLANGDCVAGGEFRNTLVVDSVTVPSGGMNDGWVARFGAASGTVAWLRTIGGPGSDFVSSIAAYDLDRIIIAGRVEGTVTSVGMQLVTEGISDVAVVGLLGDGTLDWTSMIAGSGTAALGVGGMSVDPTSSVVALPIVYAGELRVGGLTVDGGASTSAAVVVPIPR